MGKILAADMGNSNITIGCFSEGTLSFQGRVSTRPFPGREQLLLSVRSILADNGMEEAVENGEFAEGAVYSSVVPEMEDILEQVLGCFIEGPVLRADLELHTGIDLSGYDASCLGVDRIVDLLAAKELYNLPVMTCDLGTAATFSVLDGKGRFRGGMIGAGIQTSLRALAEFTSQLPLLKADEPGHLIGTDTASCMLSGTVIGAAAQIDGFHRLVSEELQSDLTCVVTGGLGRFVLPWCRGTVVYEPDLQMKGLYYLYRHNRGKS